MLGPARCCTRRQTQTVAACRSGAPLTVNSRITNAFFHMVKAAKICWAHSGRCQSQVACCTRLTAAASPVVTLAGLTATMAQLYADTSALRLKYFDSTNALQDRLVIDRSGNATLNASLAVGGPITAAAITMPGNAVVGGSLSLTEAASFLGNVAITGPSPYALSMRPAASPYAQNHCHKQLPQPLLDQRYNNGQLLGNISEWHGECRV